jgi:hypothetical protein
MLRRFCQATVAGVRRFKIREDDHGQRAVGYVAGFPLAVAPTLS